MTEQAESNTKTKTGWKSRRRHNDITLPSGQVVDIALPNLPALAKANALPNDLIEVATAAATTGKVPDDLLDKLEEFHRFLVAKTVVKPEITEEEVHDLPPEDISMLVEIATRQRDLDAVGHHLAGLEKIDDFRRFRGLDDGGSGLLGLQGVGT